MTAREADEATRIDWPAQQYRVSRELQRQRRKWGVQDHHPDYWFVLATEEWGEVAEALCQRRVADVLMEITHTMAVLAQLAAAVEGAVDCLADQSDDR